MKKIKILHIITRLTIGGVAAHLIQLSQFFNNDEYETLIMTGKIDKDDLEMTEYNQSRIKPLYLNSLQRSINPFRDLISIFQLCLILKRIKPDIVHTHTTKAGLIGRIAAFICKTPVIIHTYHGLNFEGYFGSFFSKVSVILERLLAKISTYLITLAHSQERELKNLNIGIPSQRLIIPLGFNFQENDQLSLKEKFNIPEYHTIVAIIGRLAPIKNHDAFIEIARRVVNINSNFTFLIIGDGERKQELQLLIEKQNLQKNIIITGYIENMLDYYKDIDISLLTSLNEGTPVTIIEAINFKKLVISSNVGGVVDIIKDAVNGYTYDLNNTDKAVNLILEYSSNPSKFRTIIDHAFSTSLDSFKLESMLNHYQNIYRIDHHENIVRT